jgi:hypothetical protein
MVAKQDLHDRLDQLAHKLTDAKSKQEFKRLLHDGHKLTNGELLARHEFLKQTLNGEIADFEAHGHSVSVLEQDVMNWMNSIDSA